MPFTFRKDIVQIERKRNLLFGEMKLCTLLFNSCTRVGLISVIVSKAIAKAKVIKTPHVNY